MERQRGRDRERERERNRDREGGRNREGDGWRDRIGGEEIHSTLLISISFLSHRRIDFLLSFYSFVFSFIYRKYLSVHIFLLIYLFRIY